MTQQSENLDIIHSHNGELSYRFATPLLERYDLAKEPYMEFRQGIEMTTYNDSTRTVESTLVANYAIFYEDREIWEAKGDVEVVNVDGDKLETQQLFWNQKKQRIYSNVDSKVTQGEDVMYGTGFESDETFTDFIFRKPRGRVEVDMAPTAPDSLASDSLLLEQGVNADDVAANAAAAMAITGDDDYDELQDEQVDGTEDNDQPEAGAEAGAEAKAESEPAPRAVRPTPRGDTQEPDDVESRLNRRSNMRERVSTQNQ